MLLGVGRANGDASKARGPVRRMEDLIGPGIEGTAQEAARRPRPARRRGVSAYARIGVGILRSMRSALLGALLLAAFCVPAASVASAAPAGPSSTSFARFGGGHSFGGGGGFGRSRGFFGGSRSRRGFGSRPHRSRGFLRSIARALAFAYIFHLLFSGGHGIILLLVIIGGVLLLLSRRRRRRAQFG